MVHETLLVNMKVGPIGSIMSPTALPCWHGDRIGLRAQQVVRIEKSMSLHEGIVNILMAKQDKKKSLENDQKSSVEKCLKNSLLFFNGG